MCSTYKQCLCLVCSSGLTCSSLPSSQAAVSSTAPCMAEPEASRVYLTYAGKKHVLEYNLGSHNVGDLAAGVAGLLGLAPETIKLLGHGRVVHLVRDAAQTLQQAGFTNGAAFLVVGSRADEVAGVLSAKELPGLAPFEHEDRLAAARRSRALPGHHSNRRHCFGPIEPWQRPGLSPPPSAAAALLLRLASDPAIVAVMEAHGWQVGLLSEMPPEGKVGVSAVCILGYNVNQGQEISLRLRTDDLRGFRKYLRIRETLVHELAHMVYSEHDANFKQLNSQLLREVAAHEDAARAGGRLLGAAGASKHWLGDEEEEEGEQQQATLPPAMAASAASSGKTLRQLAGPAAAAGLGTRSASPQQLAAEAAARRWQAQASPGSSDTHDGVLRTPSPVPGSAAGTPAAQGPAAASPEGSPGGDDSVWKEVEAAMRHEDAATSTAEAAMQRLGAVAQTLQQPVNMQDAPLAVVDGVDMSVEAEEATAAQQADVTSTAAATAAALQDSTIPATPSTTGTDMATMVYEHSAAPPPPLQQQQQQKQQQSAVTAAEQELQDQPPQPAHENGPTLQDAAPSHGSPSDMDVDFPDGALDEVTAKKVQQVRAALAQLSATLPAQEAAAVKHTLHDIIARLLNHPEEPKHGRLRLGNAAFQRKVGQHSPAMEVLRVAGFEVKEQPVVGGTGRPEPVLCYTRHDPGLLWMVKFLLAA